MNYDEMSDEEFNNLTPEEHTKYLKKYQKNRNFGKIATCKMD